MADNVRALVIKSGTQQQIPAADSLLVGTGIDASSGSGALVIGGATATSITIGSGSITTDFPGPVQLTGDVTTVGGTTFTSDATFEGNVTFGNGPSDTVTFAETTTVIGNIAFNGDSPTWKITNLLDPTDGSQEAATAKWVEDQIAAIPAGVSSFQTSLSGLTPSTSTTGAVTLTGTLGVANGGTGAATLTGYVKGSGTSTLTASATVPGSDVSGDISGNAANVTGTVAIANGGTGQTTASAAFDALSPLTTKGDLLGFTTTDVRVSVGTNGQVLTADSAQAAGVAWSTPAPGAVFAGALTVYVDPVNGTDAPGGGTLGQPYASINYAYSQVPSLGAPSNTVYNASVGQFVTEKLVFQLAPGRYVGDVTLGFKRARVQLIGNGVQIVGNVTLAAVRADFPASSMEALKASFPAPWTGAGALTTFEITGAVGGGVEADASSDPLLVTGLSTLLFNEPTFPGSNLGANWDANYGQFYFYANRANLIGGQVIATAYTIPTTNGLPTCVIENDGCTIGEASSPVRSYLGAVPYAYASSPSTWRNGTGQATGTQSSTTLQDTTKAWTVNQYAGSTVTLTAGTGAGQTATVVSNTATALTISAPWATTPVANSTGYSLIGTANKAPSGVITLKTHNSTLGAAIGPTLVIGEIDGCRIYDIDRTMLGTVDNGGVTGSPSTSYLGMVVNQFRVYSGTGIPASRYQIGSSGSGVRYKMDSTSYTTLAFSRSTTTGILTPRTLNIPTSAGTATAGAAATITDTSKAFTTNQWAGGTITLTGGTGSGQTRTVSSNTATAITVSPAWTTPPAAGTTYTVSALVAYDLLDDSRSLAYTPTTGANWLDPDPSTVGSALDKVGALGLLASAPANGQIPIGNGTGFTVASLTAGSGVAITPGAGTISISATGSGGTVTSVDVSGGTTGLTFSGGPISGAGTITMAGTLDVDNGGTGATTLTGYLSGNGTSAFTASASIPGADVSGDISGNAANVTGTVAVDHGGTGAITLTGYLSGNGTGAFTASASIPGADVSGDISGNAANVNGTVAVDHGGTGASTLTGYLSGNGTSAFTASASIPGADVSGDISGNAANVNGTVAVDHGGTGQSSLPSGALVVGNGASAVNALSPGSNGDVLTVVSGVWTSQAVPAATDYSVVTLPTLLEVPNTAVTVAGAAAQATSASAARVAGIVAATDSVKVLGIVTCLVEAARAGQISAGDPVYLSASEAGKVTDVAPSTPTQVIAEMGIATAADGSGTVTVLWQPKSIIVL
jgi:hypothetical protein